ncbi:MAG TPA: efflux RND transporter periplasmic adaptor subunit [Verrucomicrobiae bacterium]|nr:efflux RND transporter periplasmic adaptor subunit [Verrucomicrobiae bacterium]
MKIEMKHFEKLLPQWKNWPWLRSRWAWRILAAGAILVAVLLLRPGRGYARLTSRAEMETPPSIAVAKLEREDLFREVTIPAEFRPYAEVELHAKVSGYLQQINVDIGDRVKAGQLLATLEVPELQDQLNNAIATKQRAEADYKNAHLVYTRLLAVNKDHPNLVAQQDLDTAESKDSTTAALIAEAKANVERYQTMVAYTRITAPFDGTITHRYADPGALIQAGTASDTQSMPLVRLSNNYRLRLDFPVSVDSVKDIHLGDPVAVRVESLGGRLFTGTISRFTHKVDDNTRTMITEMEVDNPDLELVPGMYASAVLKVEQHRQALAVPIEAVRDGKIPTVCIINQNNELEERAVTLGLETATKYEVLSGLQEGDLVTLGNPGGIKPGQKVEAKFASLAAEK